MRSAQKIFAFFVNFIQNSTLHFGLRWNSIHIGDFSAKMQNSATVCVSGACPVDRIVCFFVRKRNQ